MPGIKEAYSKAMNQGHSAAWDTKLGKKRCDATALL